MFVFRFVRAFVPVSRVFFSLFDLPITLARAFSRFVLVITTHPPCLTHMRVAFSPHVNSDSRVRTLFAFSRFALAAH